MLIEIIHFLEQFKSEFFRITIAMLLGGLIGWERERHGRPAGFRTHILVCVGSALFMLVSEQIFTKYQELDSSSVARIDPARIAAGIVAGIGFLGAGTIMKHKTTVRGLTTASCLWVAAGIGMAVGTGYLMLAIFTTIIAMIVLLFLAVLERKLPTHNYRMLKIWVKDEDFKVRHIEEIIEKYSGEIRKYSLENDIEKNESMFEMDIRFINKQKDEQELTSIAQMIEEQISGLRKLKWD